MASKIRVSGTTGLFVTALGRIIREHLEFDVYDHECWTFTMCNEREECGSRGKCVWHGFGIRDSDDYNPCYPFKIRTYLGSGHVGVRVLRKVQLRVVIDYTHWDVGGDNYDVRIWTRDKEGKINKGVFGILDDGTPYATERPISDYPPQKIALWKETADDDEGRDLSM